MKSKWYMVSLAAIVVVSLSVVKVKAAPTPKVTKWVHATAVVPAAFNYIYQTERLADAVAEATDGLLQLKVSTELFKASETLYAVRDGRVPMGFIIQPYFSADVPLFNISCLPWLFGLQEFEATHEYPYVLDNYLFDVFKKIYAEKFNSVLLASGCWVTSYTLTTSPIKTVEDWKGKKLRAHGVEGAEALKALGSSPVVMTISEARDAMARGMVDGLTTDLRTFYAIGLHEVCKYTNLWPMGGIASWSIIANKDAFEALPADMQLKVKKVFKYFQDINNYKGIIYDERASRHNLKNAGEVFVRPADEEIAKGFEVIKAAGVWKRFVESNEKKGLPGAETLKEVQRLVNEFRAKYGREY